MKKSKILSLLLLLSFIASPLFGTAARVEAKPAQAIPLDLTQQAQTNAPNDEFGQTGTTGQMRTTTTAMRIAAALHLNTENRGSSAVTFAGINPDTAKYSPLAKLGGALAKMVDALTPPDYFGVANWANSPLPQLDATGNVIP